MKTNNNSMDLVKNIRLIRDELNLELMNMTLEQEKVFFKEALAKLKDKKKVRLSKISAVLPSN